MKLFLHLSHEIVGKFPIVVHKLLMALKTSELSAFKFNKGFKSFLFTFDINSLDKSFIIYPWFFTVSTKDLKVILIISFTFLQSLRDYMIF